MERANKNGIFKSGKGENPSWKKKLWKDFMECFPLISLNIWFVLKFSVKKNSRFFFGNDFKFIKTQTQLKIVSKPAFCLAIKILMEVWHGFYYRQYIDLSIFEMN